MNEHPLVQLTLARMREFHREPEAIFWVFGFPIVLAFALGLAFRNAGPGELKVGVAAGAGDSVLAATLDASPQLGAAVLDSGTARMGRCGLAASRCSSSPATPWSIATTRRAPRAGSR